MSSKILLVLIIISLLLLNLFGIRESKAQSRSKYMDDGDSYLKQFVRYKIYGGDYMSAYAIAALASYTAAIAEKQ